TNGDAALYASDQSHATWALNSDGSINFDGGVCPDSHPYRFASLFVEVYYGASYNDCPLRSDGKPRLVLSTGDPTGFSFHVDFFNGWENDPATGQSVLRGALDQCGANLVNFFDPQNCPYIVGGGFADGTQNKCALDDSSLYNALDASTLKIDANSGNVNFADINLPALPGCNPIRDGPAMAPILPLSTCNLTASSLRRFQLQLRPQLQHQLEFYLVVLRIVSPTATTTRGATAIDTSADAITTGARRGKWTKGTHVPPLDFSRVDLRAEFDLGKYKGAITSGPFPVENATNGEVYSFLSSERADGHSNCVLTRAYGKSFASHQAKPVGARHKHRFTYRSCLAYDAAGAQALDSAEAESHPAAHRFYYAAGRTDKAPFLLRVYSGGAAVDWAFQRYMHSRLKNFLPDRANPDLVMSAAVAVHPESGDAFVAWNFADGTPTVVLRYSVEDDLLSQVATLVPGFVVSSPGGLAVTVNGTLLFGGTTTADLQGVRHSTRLFMLEIDLESPDSPILYRHWPVNHEKSDNKDVVATNLVYDRADGSAYIGGHAATPHSALFKLETAAPFARVFNLKRHGFDGLVRSVAAAPADASYAVVDRPSVCVREVLTFPRLLDAKPQQLRLPEAEADGSLPALGPSPSEADPAAAAAAPAAQVHIRVSAARPGLLVAAAASAAPGDSAATFPMSARLGATRSRILLVHRVTRMPLTASADGITRLFPYEPLDEKSGPPPTLFQQWDALPGARGGSLRSAGIPGSALTIAGRPHVVPGYDQERGHRAAVRPYRAAATQRWTLRDDGTVVNSLDGRCLGLDREYLRDNRFPGKAGRHDGNQTWFHFTGIPVVTVYCLYDRLILWDVVQVA
ncbi:hypothetical protein HK405_008013, partial [Cladochytrium tenue]